ncbi:EI24 domain-containing protein [Dactylosporangium sp. AC04546]|uniref:EI24 domain-containing protein n=1 Tax=Dactylosporangium sp. AC04546 TaxID=2862460 RepID=UPI001EDFCA22|nr:EI24 domain-containing protein [Dactylosporangium sp. AC04546]WVK83659.1 EI24 domain-containing protein [Dactylosporangium sp. AC04546]
MAARAALLAGAAGRQTVKGAKRVGSSIGNFFTGMGYVFLGAGHFLRSPRLWLLVLVPLGLTALAIFGLHEATLALAGAVVDWLVGFVDGWPSVVRRVIEVLLWIGATIFFHAAMTALTVPLTMLFGAAFFPFITRAVVGKDPRPPAWHRAAGVCLRQTVVVTVVLQLGWLVIVPLLWIPGLNVAAAIAVGVVFNGYLIGLLVLSVPMHHHGVARLGEQFRFAWRHRSFTLGFGVMSLGALLIPVLLVRLLLVLPISPLAVTPGVALYLVTAPSVLVGGTLLFRRITRSAAARTTPTGAVAPWPGPTPPYGPPAARYGAPASAYGAPGPAHGGPGSAYGAPGSAYGQPGPAYGTPGSAAYGTPASTHGAPSPAPGPAHGTPGSAAYGTPAPTHGTPSPAPGPAHGAPGPAHGSQAPGWRQR